MFCLHLHKAGSIPIPSLHTNSSKSTCSLHFVRSCPTLGLHFVDTGCLPLLHNVDLLAKLVIIKKPYSKQHHTNNIFIAIAVAVIKDEASLTWNGISAHITRNVGALHMCTSCARQPRQHTAQIPTHCAIQQVLVNMCTWGLNLAYTEFTFSLDIHHA